MTRVVFHYWAGARAAAGTAAETFEAGSVSDALAMAQAAHGDPRFDQVLTASSLMRDGRVLHESDLTADLKADLEVGVEVLPPFAGGAERCVSIDGH